jgi:DNA-binding IclR family transcriptional regulator
MSKAAASRLLASLAACGLVERDSAQRYVLGLRLWEFGAQAARRLRIADIGRALLLQTANETGARLHLSVLRGDKAFFLEMTDFARSGAAIPIVPAMPVVPAYACAPGKVMLAAEPDEHLHTIAGATFQAYTPRTITSGRELLDQLRQVREQGYALNTGEYLRGHIGLALPIYDYTGHVIASVGCSGFESDFEHGDPLTRLPEMLDLAQSISALLGYKSGARTSVG